MNKKDQAKVARAEAIEAAARKARAWFDNSIHKPYKPVTNVSPRSCGSCGTKGGVPKAGDTSFIHVAKGNTPAPKGWKKHQIGDVAVYWKEDK